MRAAALTRLFRIALLVLFALAVALAPTGVADAKGGPANGNDPAKPPAKPQPKPAPAVPEGALERMERRLDRLALRVARLGEQARTDPRVRQVEIYKKYTSDDFKRRNREYKAKDLVEWVFDTSADFQLRDSAWKALVSQRWRDPDLTDFRKGSRQSPRAKMSRFEIVPQLKNPEDRNSRGFAQDILDGFWGDTPESAIAAYKPLKKFSGTWRPAATAWGRYLKKK